MGSTQSRRSARAIQLSANIVGSSLVPVPIPSAPPADDDFTTLYPEESSSISSLPTNNTESLENENLRCVICLSDPQTPSICPKCSKLFCRICITQWLSQQRNSSCPNCRQEITLNELVTIRWFDDVMALQKISSISQNTDVPLIIEGQDVCNVHKRAYELYCIDCEICLCNGCMDHTIHESHVFQKLATICSSKTTRLLDGMNKVRQHVTELDNLEKLMQEILNEVEKKRYNSVQKLHDNVKIEIKRLDETYYKEIKSLVEAKKLEVITQKKNINRSILEDEISIWECSRWQFLKEYPRTVKKYEDFLAFPIDAFVELVEVMKTKSSQISPPNVDYLLLKPQSVNFLRSSDLSKPTTTVSFTDDLNFSWQFVFTLIDSKKRTFQARFLLKNGFFKGMYNYMVSVLHPIDPKKKIVKKINNQNPNGEYGVSLNFEIGFGFNELNYSVHPVDILGCLKQWNIILTDKNETNQKKMTQLIRDNEQLHKINNETYRDLTVRHTRENTEMKNKLMNEIKELKDKLKDNSAGIDNTENETGESEESKEKILPSILPCVSNQNIPTTENKRLEFAIKYVPAQDIMMTTHRKMTQLMRDNEQLRKINNEAFRDLTVRHTRENTELKNTLMNEIKELKDKLKDNAAGIDNTGNETGESEESKEKILPSILASVSDQNIPTMENKKLELAKKYVPAQDIMMTRNASDRYKWVSSTIYDVNTNKWELQLIWDSLKNITYHLYLLEGSGNHHYQVSIGHRNRRLKIEYFRFKSPALNKTCIKLSPEKGFALALLKMDTIKLTIKIERQS